MENPILPLYPDELCRPRRVCSLRQKRYHGVVARFLGPPESVSRDETTVPKLYSVVNIGYVMSPKSDTSEKLTLPPGSCATRVRLYGIYLQI